MKRVTYPCGHSHVGFATPILCPACEAERVLLALLADVDSLNRRVVLGLPDGGRKA